MEFFEDHNKVLKNDNRELIQKINIILASQSTEELKLLYEIVSTIRTYKDI